MVNSGGGGVKPHLNTFQQFLNLKSLSYSPFYNSLQFSQKLYEIINKQAVHDKQTNNKDTYKKCITNICILQISSLLTPTKNFNFLFPFLSSDFQSQTWEKVKRFKLKIQEII